MRRNSSEFAVLNRVVCLLLGFALAGTGRLAAGELREPWREVLPSTGGVVLDLLGLRPGSRPLPVPLLGKHRGSLLAEPGRRHARRFLPTCGVEVDPNGHCL